MRLSEKDKKGLIVLMAGMAVLLAMVTLKIILTVNQVKLDSHYCPLDEPYPHTLILIDKTDPLSNSQKQYVKKFANDLKRNLEPLEKVSIYYFDGGYHLTSIPEFSMCNPGTGEQANALYQNPQLIQDKFKHEFEIPFDAVLDNIGTTSNSPVSPLIEILGELSGLPDFRSTQSNRKLIILSDMMQNTSEYSHYNDSMSFRDFSSTEYAARNLAMLGGVEVSLIYLWRAGLHKTQGTKHIAFWESYFKNKGAKLTEVQRIR